MSRLDFSLDHTVIDGHDDLRYLPESVMGAVVELAAGHARQGQPGYLPAVLVVDDDGDTAVDLTALQTAARSDQRKTAFAAVIVALLHAHGEGRELPEPTGTDIIRALTYGYDDGNSAALLRAMALLIGGEVDAGRAQFTELTDPERAAAHAQVNAAISSRVADADFGAAARARGMPSVSLDEDGNVIETAPDGTVRKL